MQVNQCGGVMIGLHDHVDVTVKSGGHEVCSVAQLVKSEGGGNKCDPEQLIRSVEVDLMEKR